MNIFVKLKGCVMGNEENRENLIMMSARKINGIDQAQTQAERNEIFEREKAKSFTVFIQMHGCPFGNPDIKWELPSTPLKELSRSNSG